MHIKSAKDIAEIAKEARKSQGMTQKKLAMLCNVGTRFIVDLEKGKPTLELEKTLKVLNMLGVKLETHFPFAFGPNVQGLFKDFKTQTFPAIEGKDND